MVVGTHCRITALPQATRPSDDFSTPLSSPCAPGVAQEAPGRCVSRYHAQVKGQGSQGPPRARRQRVHPGVGPLSQRGWRSERSKGGLPRGHPRWHLDPPLMGEVESPTQVVGDAQVVGDTPRCRVPSDIFTPPVIPVRQSQGELRWGLQLRRGECQSRIVPAELLNAKERGDHAGQSDGRARRALRALKIKTWRECQILRAHDTTPQQHQHGSGGSHGSPVTMSGRTPVLTTAPRQPLRDYGTNG